MKTDNLKCPTCNQEMQIIAKGRKSRRFWGCGNCSSDPDEPVLYYQPASLKAVRKLEQGPLIDLSGLSAK